MAATFAFNRDTGAATGTPTQGTTRAAVTDSNWKNVDDTTTLYSASPINAGNNSFDIWNFGVFSGTYNQISAVLFAHTAGALGAGLTVKGVPSTASTSGLAYTTPSTAANSSLTVDMTSAVAITSGVTVYVGATGPQAATMATSTTANPAYTNYLTTQLQTTTAAAPGDTTTLTLTVQYNEN